MGSAAELQGRAVGSYRVVRLLGAGAMGKVFLLEHTRLPNTFAALKVLDPKRGAASLLRERFVQEAMVAAAIGGDRVARPLDIGQFDDGTPFIIMEYVEGRTVAEAIEAGGPLPLTTALVVAYRVADTISLAHARGIVHRDVKPSNVMLTDEGQVRVKVLDFGVARAVGEIKIAQTLESAVIGSPGYMSPEAATGMVVDERTDVFSLAVTLFKMLTGELPFTGDNPQAMVAAMLTRPPRTIADARPAALGAVPPALETLMATALHKEARERPAMTELRDALLSLLADIAPALANALVGETAPHAPSLPREVDVLGSTVQHAANPSSLRAELERFAQARVLPSTARIEGRRWARWLLPLLLVGGVALAFFARRRPSAAPLRQVLPAQRQLTTSGSVESLDLAPDGKRVAWVDDGAVYLRDLDSNVTRSVWPSGGDDVFFSADGKTLYFTRIDHGEHDTLAAPSAGGDAIRAPWLDRGHADFSPDGARIAFTDYPWRSVLIAGAAGNKLGSVEIEGSYTWLSRARWSPAGDRLLVVTAAGEVETARIVTLDGKQQSLLSLEGGVQFDWYDADTILYARRQGSEVARDLLIQPLDQSRLHAAGEARMVLSKVRSNVFVTARDGSRAAYLSSEDGGSNLLSVSIGADDKPRTHRIELGTAIVCDAIISPDGRQYGVTVFDGVRAEIVTMPAEGGARHHIADLAECTRVAWSPDGARLAWRDGKTLVVDGAAGGVPRRMALTEPSGTELSVVWLDAGHVLYHVEGHRQWRIVDVADGAITPLTKLEPAHGWYFRPVPSPDGKLVAVLWNRRPTAGVWIIDTRDGQERFIGGTMATPPIGWSSDGKFIYVMDYGDESSRSLRILRLAVGGGAPQPWVTLPMGHAAPCSFARDGRTAVCIDRLVRNDVWLIENFRDLVSAAR